MTNKHDYVPGEDGYCVAMVSGTRCDLPTQAVCHQDLPPVRNESNRRPRERQDF